MKYRSEIDGLRALAVIPVILFHAGIKPFAGGFVGVDIFFVISGYLITTILFSEMEDDRFSIVNFYERRARRIVPALFFVILCCLPFSWIWLSSSDLKDFSQSLMAVVSFSSNILFWHESGYFETAAELKPLLHTWSLAVEEQYYIVFPLILLLLWKLRRRWIFCAIFAAAMLSLIAAQWGAYNIPSAAFFLLPFRFWELAIGALIALYLQYRPAQPNLLSQSRKTRELLGLIGLSLIFYSIFSFDKATPFPSLYALAPTLGTGLIILCSTTETWVSKILSTKPLVGIGLLSYSAYLWHQPLFVFARHQHHGTPKLSTLLTLCLVSLALAYLIWRFVEIPFRNKNLFTRKRIFNLTLCGSLALAIAGYTGHANEGFTGRVSLEKRKIEAFRRYDFASFYRLGDCFLRQEQTYADFSSACYDGSISDRAMIWGDSHAAALSYGLSQNATELIQITSGSCPPLVGLTLDKQQTCTDINDFALKTIETYLPQKIYLHANWLLYQNEEIIKNNAALTGYLQSTLREIAKRSPNSEVSVVGGVPQWEKSLPDVLIKKSLKVDQTINLPLEKKTYHALTHIDTALKACTTEAEATFVSPLELLCVADLCPAVIGEQGAFSPTAWDYGHLTAEGSVLLADKVETRAENLMTPAKIKLVQGTPPPEAPSPAPSRF
ncbi:MAG: acyltransferase [Desulfuromonas sp.]|nr:MAG: acyltransferase [Desulfuromonas sp.]